MLSLSPEPLSLANKLIKTPIKLADYLELPVKEKSNHKSNKHIIIYAKRHHACTNNAN